MPATSTPHKPVLFLDLAGLQCPMPVLRVRKALHELPQGGIVEALCTDPMAEIDIPELAQALRVRLAIRKTPKGTLFRIEKP